jgi:putative tryptophan/tyrosine transport system substrate-binding protein
MGPMGAQPFVRHTGRRDFIAGLEGAVAWPLAARARQPSLPVIGFIRVGSPADAAFEAFLEGLRRTGYVDGSNVQIEFRWPEDQGDRMRELMDELVRKRSP